MNTNQFLQEPQKKPVRLGLATHSSGSNPGSGGQMKPLQLGKPIRLNQPQKMQPGIPPMIHTSSVSSLEEGEERTPGSRQQSAEFSFGRLNSSMSSLEEGEERASLSGAMQPHSTNPTAQVTSLPGSTQPYGNSELSSPEDELRPTSTQQKQPAAAQNVDNDGLSSSDDERGMPTVGMGEKTHSRGNSKDFASGLSSSDDEDGPSVGFNRQPTNDLRTDVSVPANEGQPSTLQPPGAATVPEQQQTLKQALEDRLSSDDEDEATQIVSSQTVPIAGSGQQSSLSQQQMPSHSPSKAPFPSQSTAAGIHNSVQQLQTGNPLLEPSNNELSSDDDDGPGVMLSQDLPLKQTTIDSVKQESNDSMQETNFSPTQEQVSGPIVQSNQPMEHSVTGDMSSDDEGGGPSLNQSSILHPEMVPSSNRCEEVPSTLVAKPSLQDANKGEISSSDSEDEGATFNSTQRKASDPSQNLMEQQEQQGQSSLVSGSAEQSGDQPGSNVNQRQPDGKMPAEALSSSDDEAVTSIKTSQDAHPLTAAASATKDEEGLSSSDDDDDGDGFRTSLVSTNNAPPIKPNSPDTVQPSQVAKAPKSLVKPTVLRTPLDLKLKKEAALKSEDMAPRVASPLKLGQEAQVTLPPDEDAVKINQEPSTLIGHEVHAKQDLPETKPELTLTHQLSVGEIEESVEQAGDTVKPDEFQETKPEPVLKKELSIGEINDETNESLIPNKEEPVKKETDSDIEMEDGQLESGVDRPPAPGREEDMDYETDPVVDNRAVSLKRPRSGSGVAIDDSRHDSLKLSLSSDDEEYYSFSHDRKRQRKDRAPNDLTPETPPPLRSSQSTSLEHANWKRFRDGDEGRVYYHNNATGKTQWDRPKIFDQDKSPTEEGEADDISVNSSSSEDSPLANLDAEKIKDDVYFLGGDLIRAGPWREYVDNRNKRYYHNRETGVTQWEEPEPIAAVRLKRFEQYAQQLETMDSSMNSSGGGSLTMTQQLSASSLSDLDTSRAAANALEQSNIKQQQDPIAKESEPPAEDNSTEAMDAVTMQESEGEAKDEDKDSKNLFERFLAERKENPKEEAVSSEDDDPAAKLQQTDSIMENGCLGWIEAYKDSQGGFSLDAVKQVIDFLSDNYRGYARLVRHLERWISLTQSEDNQIDVEEFILGKMEALIERHFDADKADKVLERYSDCPDYLRIMMSKKRWRNVLLKLFNRHENSALLGFCVRQLSVKGFHHDIAEVLSRPDDFSVFRGCVVALISEVISKPEYCTALTRSTEPTVTNQAALRKGRKADTVDAPASARVLMNLRRLSCASAHGYLFVQELLRKLEQRASELSIVPEQETQPLNEKEDGSVDETSNEKDGSDGKKLNSVLKPAIQRCGRKFRRIRQEIGAGATELLKPVDNRPHRHRLNFLQKLGQWHCQEVLGRHGEVVINIRSILSEQKAIGSSLENLCHLYKLKDQTVNDGSNPVKLQEQKPGGERPPVKFLRHPEFLEILTDSLFGFEEQRRSSVGPSSGIRWTALILAYATHTDPALVDMEQVQQVADELQQAATLLVDVVKRHKLYKNVEDQLFRIMEAPVCSMGILRYITKQLNQSSFQRSTRYPALCPFFVSICKRALHEHGIQRSSVFQILRIILTTKIDSEIKKVMDIRRRVLNCLVHLISKGYLLPVFEFLQEPAVFKQIDHTLLRHFIGTVVSVANAPYSGAFNLAFTSFLTIETVTTAVSSQNFDEQFREKLHAYICQCLEDDKFKQNESLIMLSLKVQ